MGMVEQYQIYLINLDPTIGYEIKKTRPCIVISPNEMNSNLSTIIIAPMTTKSHDYPTRAPIRFAGKKGWVVVDQIRTIDKQRLVKILGIADFHTQLTIKNIIKEMLVD